MRSTVLSILGLFLAVVSASCAGGSTIPVSVLLSVNPASFAFGNQLLGTTSTNQTVTLMNTGNTALTFSSIVVGGANSSDFKMNTTCGSSLAPGASCTASATFTPSALGNRTASVTITDNAPGSPQSVTMTGTGTNPAPTLSSLSPPSASVGAEAQVLTLNGTNFLATSTVTYSGVAHAATFISVTQLT
ncbi:MAG TPA: choice-of-anchor D domain-containing protein, partial [Candidatus Acidoferrum sp.]|nr:choice-of-anchor D domain-containing protein [Candidatus Acidoferrum sp.]